MVVDKEQDSATELLGSYSLHHMPRDHFCFYHSIGWQQGIHGQTIFNQLVALANWLMECAPSLADIINDRLQSAGSSLNEVAVLGYVDFAGQQLWGHTGLLPLISWWYQLPIVVLDYQHANEGGALFFAQDGTWEFIQPQGNSISGPLSELQSAYSNLLILNNSNESHWDVLIPQSTALHEGESTELLLENSDDLLQSVLSDMSRF